MKILLISIMLAGLAFGAEKVTPEKAEKLIEDGVRVLDVRTEEEWNNGHLEDAVRVDWHGEDFDEKVAAEFDKDEPVLVYCRSGGRSARAAERLEKLGFATVRDLKGGITAWRKAGKKVVK